MYLIRRLISAVLAIPRVILGIFTPRRRHHHHTAYRRY